MNWTPRLWNCDSRFDNRACHSVTKGQGAPMAWRFWMQEWFTSQAGQSEMRQDFITHLTTAHNWERIKLFIWNFRFNTYGPLLTTENWNLGTWNHRREGTAVLSGGIFNINTWLKQWLQFPVPEARWCHIGRQCVFPVPWLLSEEL